jgi:hypothetical protein
MKKVGLNLLVFGLTVLAIKFVGPQSFNGPVVAIYGLSMYIIGTIGPY